ACRRGEVQTVVVAALDRLGRNMPHLVAVAEELKALGVELVSLRESIDTRTPTGRALFGMLAVCAQLERDWIAERIAVGVAAAKRAGKRAGRPRALAGDALEQAQRQARAGWSVRRIAAFHGVSRDAVSRALRAAG